MLPLLFALGVLATVALAEKGLVGQWEEQDHPGVSHSLHLAEDESFTFHTDVVLEDGFWDNQDILPELTEGLDMVQLTYTGQWEAQDGQLILTADTFSMTINGKGMWATIMDLVFETFRIREGLSKEEMTSLKAAGEERLIQQKAEQETEQVQEFNSHSQYNYSIEDSGARLVLDFDGHPLHFYRVGPTAVKAWSWGEVKASLRSGL